MPLCFDLDGTLGSFGGGYLLLREALGELWGEAPSAEDLKGCRGSTDWEIVDELHRARFHHPLQAETYAAYDAACLARFEATFGPAGRSPIVHAGLTRGITELLDSGRDVWLVSGNTPRILAFKARRLGVDSRAHQLGSLPGLTRTCLLRRAVAGGPPPHLYVGDRPHDRDAAQASGIPFLAVGEAVCGHPSLPVDAQASELLAAVARMT